jgi:hypothetical protein
MTRLVLHFDINGTITPVDTTEPGNKVENSNMVISKSVYGKFLDGKWTLNVPEQLYDTTNSITYYDYLKLVGKDYKKISFSFTEEGNPGETLAFMVPELVESMDIFLFKSFLKACDKYPGALIVFRTFGLDADEVIEFMRTNEKTKESFATMIQGTFTYPEGNPLITIEKCEQILGMETFNELLLKTPNHLAFKESYKFWNDHKRNKINGKQLLGHEKMTQIFFDDNDCVNILDPTNCHFMKVNTLRALQNEDYFVDFIRNVV